MFEHMNQQNFIFGFRDTCAFWQINSFYFSQVHLPTVNTTGSHGHHVSDGGQEAKLANHVLPYSKNTENIVTFDLRNRNFSLACDTGAFSGEVSDNG